ncbi:hypothetical protein ACFY4C_12145 [Actinomadura viridis]|uniref:hypothetical protein n=1 Tax=Actinomadura viridis TaxID=58110 RepID=UPI003697476F
MSATPAVHRRLLVRCRPLDGTQGIPAVPARRTPKGRMLRAIAEGGAVAVPARRSPSHWVDAPRNCPHPAEQRSLRLELRAGRRAGMDVPRVDMAILAVFNADDLHATLPDTTSYAHACLAHDRGIPVRVESGYLPRAVIEGLSPH